MPLIASGSRPRRSHGVLWTLGVIGFAISWGPEARGQDAPERPKGSAPRSQQGSGELNFANGLFRDRRYELAAEEYDRFLKEADPGPDADAARFGLASSRLFQGRYAEARRHFEDFVKAAPGHANAPTAWYRIGEAAYMLGDWPAARRALETFTAGNPEHRYLETAWPYLGDVCFRSGDLAQARRAYERSLELHPKGRLANRARFGLGRTLAQGDDPDAALTVLTALARGGGPDWSDKAWFQVGRIQAEKGRFAEAVEAFETLERAAPRGAQVAEARQNRAEALIRLGRRDEAEPLLRPLVADAAQPLAARAAFALVTSLLDRGEAAEALTVCDEALPRLGKDPAAPALLFRSAEAAQKLGQADAARARFLRVAEADPNDPWADDAALRAARLALEARDHAAARGVAATFATRFPQSPLRADARLIESRAALSANRPKDAIAILTASLAEDKPSPATEQVQRYYLGLAFRADGQSARAAEILDSLARSPSAPVAADAQYMVGQGHIEAGRFAEAIPPLEGYLAGKADGEVADYALAHLAQARVELGQADAASKSLEELTRRFPKSKALPPTRLRLAEAALKAGDRDRAAELFRLVIAGPDPSLAARARSGLGFALLEGGKAEEAAGVFAAVQRQNPNDPLAPEAALSRGRALEAAKKTDEALAAYAQVVEDHPKTEQAGLATLARARLLIDAGRPDDAAKAYARYVQDGPGPAGKEKGAGLDAVLAEWGWALVDAGKAAEADKVFTRLLGEFPESPSAADARFNLAESAYQAKDHDEALRLLAPLVAEGSKADPKLVQSALYRLGRTQVERKDWPGAAETFRRLLAEYPTGRFLREARFWRAEVALQAEDYKTAEADFQALATELATPSDPKELVGTARRRHIQCLVALRRWQDALTAVEAWKPEGPEDSSRDEMEYSRGRALQGLARFDEARAAYQTVINAAKGGELAARAQLMRGETFFHQKAYHEALREFLKVDILYDAPRWQAAALLEAGKVHEQLDQWADAAETYQKLLSKFPGDPHAAEATTRLDAARQRAGSAAGASAANIP